MSANDTARLAEPENPLDLEPAKPWRRLLPSWFSSLIWVDAAGSDVAFFRSGLRGLGRRTSGLGHYHQHPAVRPNSASLFRWGRTFGLLSGGRKQLGPIQHKRIK